MGKAWGIVDNVASDVSTRASTNSHSSVQFTLSPVVPCSSSTGSPSPSLCSSRRSSGQEQRSVFSSGSSSVCVDYAASFPSTNNFLTVSPKPCSNSTGSPPPSISSSGRSSRQTQHSVVSSVGSSHSPRPSGSNFLTGTDIVVDASKSKQSRRSGLQLQSAQEAKSVLPPSGLPNVLPRVHTDAKMVQPVKAWGIVDDVASDVSTRASLNSNASVQFTLSPAPCSSSTGSPSPSVCSSKRSSGQEQCCIFSSGSLSVSPRPSTNNFLTVSPKPCSNS